MAIESKNLLVWVKAMSRGQALPLDASEIYSTLAEAQNYASTSAIAYPGQTVKAKTEDGKYHTYTLQTSEAGYILEEVGAIDQSDLKQYVKIVDILPESGQIEGILYIMNTDGYIWTGSVWKKVFWDVSAEVTAVSNRVTALETEIDAKAPISNPVFSGVVKVGEDEVAMKSYVEGLFSNLVSAAPGIVDSSNPLPANHKAGQHFRVAEAGTYAGAACEAGDVILVVKNGEPNHTIICPEQTINFTPGGTGTYTEYILTSAEEITVPELIVGDTYNVIIDDFAGIYTVKYDQYDNIPVIPLDGSNIYIKRYANDSSPYYSIINYGSKVVTNGQTIEIQKVESGTSMNDDFIVLQANIDGAVTSTANAPMPGEIVMFNDSTGKIISGTGIFGGNLDMAVSMMHSHSNQTKLDSYDKTQSELLAAAKSEAQTLVTAHETAVNEALVGKAEKSTTLTGYGITDAYNKTEVDTKLTTISDNLNTKISAADVDDKIVTAKEETLNEAATASSEALKARVGDIPTDTTVKSYIDNAVGSGGTASAEAIAIAKQEAISASKGYTDTQITSALTIIEF